MRKCILDKMLINKLNNMGIINFKKKSNFYNMIIISLDNK